MISVVRSSGARTFCYAGGMIPSWSGSAQNGWMPLVMVLLLGQGAVMSLFTGDTPGAAPYLNLVHVLVLALLELFAKVSVDIDQQEIRIRYGYIGWLTQRVTLARVHTARAFQLRPMEHGGWGYRGSVRFFGRAAVVVRGGPALALELTDGKRLAVTVDDADTAADVINGILSRRPPPPVAPR
jgi:hypothetical protein